MIEQQPPFDCIVVGGGAAGLCLGHHLARLKSTANVLILERREHYVDDRSWCFWQNPKEKNWLDELVSKVWYRWEIGDGAQTVHHRAEHWPYCYVRSSDFYLAAIRNIDRAPHVILKRGVDVSRVQQTADGCRVQTDHGEFRAKSVIDARPCCHHEDQRYGLLQVFVGREIHSEQAIFDPDCAYLMRNLSAADNEVGFEYMLPFDAHRALVEQTVFASAAVAYGDLENRLEQLIHTVAGGQRIDTIRDERGIIPMVQAVSHRRGASRIYHAGLGGGAARASSGYALRRIDQWAASCAARLAVGKTPCDAYAGTRIEKTLDRIFLRALRGDLHRAPQLFLKMAMGTSGDQFARFLSGSSDPCVLYRVISEMPKRPFLMAATRELVG